VTQLYPFSRAVRQAFQVVGEQIGIPMLDDQMAEGGDPTIGGIGKSH